MFFLLSCCSTKNQKLTGNGYLYIPNTEKAIYWHCKNEKLNIKFDLKHLNNAIMINGELHEAKIIDVYGKKYHLKPNDFKSLKCKKLKNKKINSSPIMYS